jgi:peptide/nickel transport system substrate-binding protein
MTANLALSRRAAMGIAASLTAGALGFARTAHAAATRGGKLIFGRYEDSQYLDPVMTEINADIWVMTNLFGMLIEPSLDGKGLSPGLATKWAWNDDGTLLTLDLRAGVKFSDGSPFSAEDVKFTLDRVVGLKDAPWNSMVESITAVTIVDPLKVTLKTAHPDPALLAALGMFITCILPKAAVMAVPGADVEAKVKAFVAKPVGTGPFMMTEWSRGTVMRLKRNPNYWKKDAAGQALPYLDELEFPIIKDDATRLLKLKAGEIDGTELIPYARVAELKAEKNLRVELWPSTKTVLYIMNCRPTLKDGSKNPLSDVRVRQALNYAINKQAIIQITTQGLGTPMKTYLSSATPLAYGPSPLYSYDVAKAKALLKEAGHENGFEISVLSLAGNQDETTNATALQQMWAQVGVKLKIELVDLATRLARYKANDFSLRGYYWTDDIFDPSEATSYYVYSETNQALHTGLVVPRLNELFLASQKEVDVAKRTEMYKEIQITYNDLAPIIYLYEVPYPVVFLTKAKGFVQLPLGNNIFEGAYVES